MSDVNPTSLSCPFCDTIVVYKSALHCDKCGHWVHYSCSKLPAYAIIQLKQSSRLFSCHTCVHERFKNDFPELHTEIEGIIKEKNDSLLAFIMSNSPPVNLSSTPIIATSPHLDISRSQISYPTSVLTTNPRLVRVPIPSTSDFIDTHTASNSNRVTSVATSTMPHYPKFIPLQSSLPVISTCKDHISMANVAVTALSLTHQCALNL